jgi:NADP-dependent 3-hydroxy acid dehydrogenase YdfG
MARTPRPLAGRVVAITGAARGIGYVTAQVLVRAGMRVAVGDLDLVGAQRAAAELGHGTIAVELDVCDRISFAHFLDETEARLGPLDVLVNNAGIMQLGRLVDEDDATARRQVDINVHGVLHGCKEALPRMLGRNSGHVVNIASTAGKVGFAGGATYSGTKHFVVGVSEAARVELRGTAIEISCVMPGIVKTELGAGLGQARFIKHTEPEAVAAAIAGVLREPRFDVFVPRAIGPLITLANVLPRPAREVVARALKTDRVLDLPDASARAEYDRRAARSGAGLPAGAEDPTSLPPAADE